MRIPRWMAKRLVRLRRRLPEPVTSVIDTVRSLTGSGPIFGVPDFDSVLVLAPHPDDEVIGCGGLIALLARAGTDVHVVYVTDGEATIASVASTDEVGSRRRSEGAAACEILGAHPPQSLGFPDGELEQEGDAVAAAIMALVEEIRPDAVLAPWEFDGHADHRAVHRAVPRDVMLWGYEVWRPLTPEWVVDITTVLDVKREAVEVLTTAAGAFDPTAMLGLNRYRSLVAQAGDGYAEAFTVRSASATD